ncbi:MAG: carbon-nitrogen hydrolase family protein [Defluviicoccus sp.]|nr:carbon-nitrogen hydrolase family protein [Defluviicoccus sp.]
MAAPFTVACVQTNTGNDAAANMSAALALARDAHAAGADLIAFPEVVGLVEPDPAALAAEARGESDHRALAAFKAFAAASGAWLLVGSLTVGTGGDRLANRSFLVDPRGRIAARYDKIHLFDVDLPDGRRSRESERYRAGAAAVLAALPWGGLGMTVCYDLRFPALYWDLAQAGADFLAVPSAFTRITGRAHWHALLRARAIETGCYVIAPAQCGDHAGGRESYGHSLVVEPWGGIVADGGEEVGFVLAEIDPARVREARAALPALANARHYAPPSSLRAGE